MRAALPTTAALGALLLLAGCGRRHPPASTSRPPAPMPRQATSKALGIVVSPLPVAFSVAADPQGGLRLANSGGGTLTVEAGTSARPHPDLMAAVRGEETRVRGVPSGQSFGSIELMCQLGRAYLTRGRYRSSGNEIEILRVFALHPYDLDRSLILTYEYPITESGRERVDEMLAVLGGIAARSR